MNLYVFKIIAFFMPALSFAWDIEQAQKILMEKNTGYQNAVLEVESSKLKLSIAKVTRYPQIDLRAGFDRFLQQDATLGYRAFVGPRISLPVYRGGYLQANKRLSEGRYTTEQYLMQVELLDKTQQLQEAFAKAMYAKNYLSVARNTLDRSKKNLRLVELKFKSGHEYRWVYLTAKKNFEEDQLQVMEAKFDQRVALVELENLLGELPVKTVNEIDDAGLYDGSTEVASVPQDPDLTSHPEYMAQVGFVEQSHQEYLKVRALRYPNINFRTDFALIETEDKPVIPFWSAGVSFSMPLYAFGKLKNEQRVNNLEKEQQKNEAITVLRQLKLDYQTAYNDYLIAHKKLNIARIQLEAAQDRSKVTTEKYKNGLVDFDDWDRSQSVLKNAETQILVQQRDWVIAKSMLNKAIGSYQ